MAQSTPEIRAERRRLRARRLALPRRERIAAERAIVAALGRLGIFRRGRRVAVYLSMPGEVNLADALARAVRAGAELYAPSVTHRRRGAMRFARLRPGSSLRTNCFGIAEPAAGARNFSPALRLDVVLVPVVGFDRDGNRLGMGGGFYDRALSGRRDRGRLWRRPTLVGVAYACQELARIEPSAWDVRLDAIVTERGIILPRRGPAALKE